MRTAGIDTIYTSYSEYYFISSMPDNIEHQFTRHGPFWNKFELYTTQLKCRDGCSCKNTAISDDHV